MYNYGMGVRRTKHAVYDLKYHLVWVPKYRKHILSGEVSEYLKEVFQRIAEEYEFRIDTMEVMKDHVHIFVEIPPRYSPAQPAPPAEEEEATPAEEKPEVVPEVPVTPTPVAWWFWVIVGIVAAAVIGVIVWQVGLRRRV